MGTHPAALAQQIYEEALRSPLLTAFTRHHNGVAEALLADGVLLGLKIAELREATA